MASTNTEGALSDRAYRVLKEKILTLEGGNFLNARQFSNEINISYTPVREAFLRLQIEGVLKQIPSMGFFVAAMDIKEALQLYQVRECIEPFVLQIAKCMMLDIKLHEVLLDVYGNQHLKSIYHIICEKYIFCSRRIALNHEQDVLGEYLEMIEAIELRDIDLSLKALNDHIENAKQLMLEGHMKVIE